MNIQLHVLYFAKFSACQIFQLYGMSFFFFQESVCSAYCAGLSSACIVNVGDQMTSICCVEDGMSNPNTRSESRCGCHDNGHMIDKACDNCYFFFQTYALLWRERYHKIAVLATATGKLIQEGDLGKFCLGKILVVHLQS